MNDIDELLVDMTRVEAEVLDERLEDLQEKIKHEADIPDEDRQSAEKEISYLRARCADLKQKRTPLKERLESECEDA